MQNSWKKIDEEKPNYCSVDVDNIINADFQQPNHEADSHSYHKIYYFGNTDMTFVRLVYFENTK